MTGIFIGAVLVYYFIAIKKERKEIKTDNFAQLKIKAIKAKIGAEGAEQEANQAFLISKKVMQKKENKQKQQRP